MVSAVMRELYQWGLELRAWKVHEVWVHLLRHDEKNRQIAQTWCTFPANYSDMARKSGFMKARARMRFKLCLKSEPEKCKDSVFWTQILWWNQANPQILWSI